MKSAILLAFAAVVACKPTVYLIRHGEKPEKGNDLSEQGEQRAQCLRTVFGSTSEYNIGHVMAQTPKSNGKRKRPYDTVLPLAQDLGLDVDISCDRDDNECVANVVNDYSGEGNILICWQHGQMNNIAEALGASDVENYPEDHFDLIWTLPPDYKEIESVISENCPGLDN